MLNFSNFIGCGGEFSTFVKIFFFLMFDFVEVAIC